MKRAPTTVRSPSTGNLLLDCLPAAVRLDVLEAASRTSLAAEQDLIRAGEQIRHLFFPVTAVCSTLVDLRSGQRAEVATVGNEGLVGIPRILGRVNSNEHVMAQIGGTAYAVEARQLARLQQAHESLRSALLDFVGYSLQLARQTSACNAYHRIDERLARWLLTADDRADTDSFHMTHELLTHMVAATRPRVSEAAARLRDARVIDYRTGRMLICDRPRLEQLACECYGIARRSLKEMHDRRNSSLADRHSSAGVTQHSSMARPQSVTYRTPGSTKSSRAPTNRR